MKIKPDRVSALHRVLSWDPEIRVWLTDWRRGFGLGTKKSQLHLKSWRSRLKGCAAWSCSWNHGTANVGDSAVLDALPAPGCSATLLHCCLWSITATTSQGHFVLSLLLCITWPLDQNLQQLIPGHLAKRCSREVGKASLWYYWHFGRNLACVYTEYNFQVKDSHEILLSTLDDAQLVLKYLKGILGVLA